MLVINKNRKEDFKLLFAFGDKYDGCDFRLVFSTDSNYVNTKFVCSLIDGKYTNCKKVDNEHILCIFDNHNLPCGKLFVEIEYLIHDSLMPDGSVRKVNKKPVEYVDKDGNKYCIVLTNGVSDSIETSGMTIDLLGDVIKGEDGWSQIETFGDDKLMVEVKRKKYLIGGIEEYKKPSVPTFDKSISIDGNYIVTIVAEEKDCIISYSVNGSEFVTYEQPIVLTFDKQCEYTEYEITAIASKNGLDSDEGTFSCNIHRRLPQPRIIEHGSEYDSVRTIAFESEIQEAKIIVTIEGNQFEYDSNNNPVLIGDTEVSCYCTLEGWNDSYTLVKIVRVGYEGIYFGMVDEKPDSTFPLVEQFTDEFPFEIVVPNEETRPKRVCIAYMKNLGALKSIKDDNGNEYISDFDGPISIGKMYMYITKIPSDNSGIKYIFKT